MKKIILITTAVLCMIALSCKKKCTDEFIDPNKIYTGEVVRYYNPECVSTGLNTPPYLIRVSDYTLDSFITMSLPNQYRIEGKKLNFKIAEDTVNIAYLICNANIIAPKLKKIFEITE
ncbi:MAG: hypothetical protein U0T31_06260 [Chitinophagales bacterium]|nr:hypothetical protein [Chitinophagales bacterium]